jgi:molybdopterin molybdotransferase
MIPIDHALKMLADAALPLVAEEVELDRAHGRVLAESVEADRDFPSADRSAMDGFAVRSADVSEPGSVLKLNGEVRAGASAEEVRVEPGSAVRIFTGAVIPPGADTVVMIERTDENPADGSVRMLEAAQTGRHIRRRAEDRVKGEVVLQPGTVIRAAEVAVLASVGKVHIRVHRRPVVNVLSTGDEIVSPEVVPEDHQIRNSNAPTLLAQLGEMGLAGSDLGNVADRRDGLDERIARGLSGDLLIVTGGVSVGKYDLVGQALADAGMQLLFHKVKVKPGKPILAGRYKDCVVIGLPGNPVSAFTGFAVFVEPTLRKMMGYRSWMNVELRVALAEPLRCKPGRVTYHLCRIEVTEGRLAARPVSSSGSGDVLAIALADGFMITDETIGELPRGAELPVLPLRRFVTR